MSRVIYENALDNELDIKDLSFEGNGGISFAGGAMRMTSAEETVLWYTKPLPADVRIDWEFKPLSDSGTAQLHFAAKNAGDKISEFLLSYYNRGLAEERSFHTCSLYKNGPENMVYKGADPMAGAAEDTWYRLSMVKRGKDVYYGINNLELVHFHDDGITLGEILTGGNMGLGQLSGTEALYKNLKVTWI
ncbi:DUF1961 family protein [Butyrivibrio sp. XPD2006]|uniref:DUF1961 family protein n=1 Tax=Butyrivibrio sp. XPD2006 TaxID=1280668 RepID=UPI0003B59981|nr:DUF1961 family protein [Butyrivibrio sp. XPD2006]